MTREFVLERVGAMPRKLEPGILYVSMRYQVAAHLCACGCGEKVVTPLGPAEWSFRLDRRRPTLCPSIGNWQVPCQSHYFITAGRVTWLPKWSRELIETGQRHEARRRETYFEARSVRPLHPLVRLWRRIRRLVWR